MGDPNVSPDNLLVKMNASFWDGFWVGAIKAALVLAATYAVFWFGYSLGSSDTKHEIAAHWSHVCAHEWDDQECAEAVLQHQSAFCDGAMSKWLGFENEWKGK